MRELSFNEINAVKGAEFTGSGLVASAFSGAVAGGLSGALGGPGGVVGGALGGALLGAITYSAYELVDALL